MFKQEGQALEMQMASTEVQSPANTPPRKCTVPFGLRLEGPVTQQPATFQHAAEFSENCHKRTDAMLVDTRGYSWALRRLTCS